MAARQLQLDFRLTGPQLNADFPPVSSLRRKRSLTFLQPLPEDGGLEALSLQAAEVRWGQTQASHGEEGTTAEELHELLWRGFFSHPTQWWDNERSERVPRHPDFKHTKSKDASWPCNQLKPARVESQLATVDPEMGRPPEFASTAFQRATGRLAAHEGDLEVVMCQKLCEHGLVTEAVDALNVLVQRRCHVPNNLFYRVLKRCTAQKDLALGRRIHALTLKSGYEGNAFLATHLISLYASHGRLDDAMTVFSKVATPDAYNWSSIILAYARHGEPTQAIRLYRKQRSQSAVKSDNHIFLAVLKACASARDLATGKDVHAHIVASAGKPDIFVQTCLVDMYAKCGSLEDARRVFERLAQKDVVTWTAMIAGYAHQGKGNEALGLYSRMVREGMTPPDSFTFACLLQACASVGVEGLQQGKQLHSQIKVQGMQGDVVVGANLVNMYAKCGSVQDARQLFDLLPHKNVVTWTAMIAGYTQQAMGQEALSLYCGMLQDGITPPDSVTFVCLLQACASVGAVALDQGKQLHAEIEGRGLQDDVVIGASLVNMYVKCGSVEHAQGVFGKLPEKNVVTWTAIIAGYAQQGMAQEALMLYCSMQREGINPPDSVTFVCLLQACAAVAALPLGEQLNAQIEERGLQGDVVVGSSLVNMYAKCGSMADSQRVFDSLRERDMAAWGALTAGYARHGESEAVFDLLDRMKLEGIQPDGITFLSVLTVCSHVGLLEKGRRYFETMSRDFGIAPTIEHYTCMMDLLGRAGHLSEALQMAKTMPFRPNDTVWLSLLGACRKWNNVKIGRQVFEFAVSTNETGASSYVLMSNIYAGAQMWDEAKEMQARRVKSKAWKQPGQSWWTDLDGVVHTFIVGDKKHPESEGIYARLEQLLPKIKKEGYIPHLNSSLRDMPDAEKETELCGHSEKLAIAYALNKTPEGTIIRVVKNLRVCMDCHTATAFISKVERRTIICRDASRFHVFKDGKCSCGDYW